MRAFFALAALVINQAAAKEKIFKQILTENTKCERARYAGKGQNRNSEYEKQEEKRLWFKITRSSRDFSRMKLISLMKDFRASVAQVTLTWII